VTSIHLSVDDVLSLPRELDDGAFESVWQHPGFGFLHRLHHEYGAVFSLYCFWTDGSWDLGGVTTAYAAELSEAASWLRWGFHAYDEGTIYHDGFPPGQAAEHYRLVTGAIARFAGENALDRMPRNHYFSGSLEVVRCWREAPRGILGLLTADDLRARNYYLDARQRTALAAGTDLYDEAERLHLVRTDLRLESVDDPLLALDSLSRTLPGEIHSVFTHEEHLGTAEIRAKIELVCQWASANGAAFRFPQDSRGS
jgi:hypothetical protein